MIEIKNPICPFHLKYEYKHVILLNTELNKT